ncbi:MAG TPA: hypothetical protein VM243_07605 [Phycisphaerae bacterium]|nr:hypothetical protein [Phycisphaerae bacterium]
MRYSRAVTAAAVGVLLCLPAWAGDWVTTPGGTTVREGVKSGTTAWIEDFAVTSGFLATDQCSCSESYVTWNADTSAASGGAADVDIQTCSSTPASPSANECGDYFTTPMTSANSGAQEICGSILRVVVNTPPGGGETPRLGYFCK